MALYNSFASIYGSGPGATVTAAVRVRSRMTTQQQQMLVELAGLRDQIEKGHYLNVHFRAFQLSHAAWMEHTRQGAAASHRTPGGLPQSVLEEPRS